MKKLVSVLLALLMLALPVLAGAEAVTAPGPDGLMYAARISDPVVEFAGTKIDLTGLDVSTAFGFGDEGGKLALYASAKDKALAGVIAEFTSEGIYFVGDGMSSVYYIGYTDLLNAIQPGLADQLGSVIEFAKTIPALFSEENLMDFAGRLQVAVQEIMEIASNGMTMVNEPATVNGADFNGSKIKFAYDGAALKSMLLSVAKAYDGNPGFKAYMDGLAKLALGEGSLSIVDALESVDIEAGVTGEIFVSENSDAAQLNVAIGSGEDTATISGFYTMGANGIEFGLGAEADGDKLAVNGSFANELKMVVTANDEKVLDVTAGAAENGIAVKAETASDVVDIVIGGNPLVAVTANCYLENDFSHATLDKTEDIQLNFGELENGVGFTLHDSIAYASGESTYTDVSLLGTPVEGQNGFNVKLTVDDNGDVATGELALGIADDGLTMKFDVTANNETVVSYDLKCTIAGEEISYEMNEYAAGMTETMTFKGTKKDNVIAGHMTADVGPSLMKLDTDVAYSFTGKPEMEISKSQNVKNVMDIIAAGTDSAQFSAFVMDWYGLAMNAVADFQNAFPEVAAMFQSSEIE